MDQEESTTHMVSGGSQSPPPPPTAIPSPGMLVAEEGRGGAEDVPRKSKLEKSEKKKKRKEKETKLKADNASRDLLENTSPGNTTTVDGEGLGVGVEGSSILTLPSPSTSPINTSKTVLATTHATTGQGVVSLAPVLDDVTIGSSPLLVPASSSNMYGMMGSSSVISPAGSAASDAANGTSSSRLAAGGSNSLSQRGGIPLDGGSYSRVSSSGLSGAGFVTPSVVRMDPPDDSLRMSSDSGGLRQGGSKRGSSTGSLLTMTQTGGTVAILPPRMPLPPSPCATGLGTTMRTPLATIDDPAVSPPSPSSQSLALQQSPHASAANHFGADEDDNPEGVAGLEDKTTVNVYDGLRSGTEQKASFPINRFPVRSLKRAEVFFSIAGWCAAFGLWITITWVVASIRENLRDVNPLHHLIQGADAAIGCLTALSVVLIVMLGSQVYWMVRVRDVVESAMGTTVERFEDPMVAQLSSPDGSGAGFDSGEGSGNFSLEGGRTGGGGGAGAEGHTEGGTIMNSHGVAGTGVEGHTTSRSRQGTSALEAKLQDSRREVDALRRALKRLQEEPTTYNLRASSSSSVNNEKNTPITSARQHKYAEMEAHERGKQELQVQFDESRAAAAEELDRAQADNTEQQAASARHVASLETLCERLGVSREELDEVRRKTVSPPSGCS